MNRSRMPAPRRRRSRRRRAFKTRLWRELPRVSSAALLLFLAAAVSTYCARPQEADSGLEEAHFATNSAAQYRSLDDPSATAEPENTAPGTVKNDEKTTDSSPRSSGQRLRPADHTIEWMQRHGAVARSASDDCMSCHQEEDCLSCHTEDLSEFFSIHPPNYAVAHAIDAQLDSQDCTSCHQVETFCTECHMRAGVSAMEDFAPPPHADYHPPGWLDASNPGNHGVRARRDITDCASCHREQDCVTCHIGVNPHPPEFRLNCRAWLNADARSCAQCHGSELDALRTMCL